MAYDVRLVESNEADLTTRLSLSAEAILQAALRLVDDEGIEALTMRRLAGELGVATMSLYGHVSNKDELLLGVVDLATREITLPEPGTEPWKALRSIIRNFRKAALRHPNLVPLIVRQPPTGIEGLHTLEAALDALRRAGMEPGDAAYAYRLTASYAIGFVSLECGGFFKPLSLRVDPADLATLPRIVQTAPHLAEWDADAEFERGMDLIIEALRAKIG